MTEERKDLRAFDTEEAAVEYGLGCSLGEEGIRERCGKDEGASLRSPGANSHMSACCVGNIVGSAVPYTHEPYAGLHEAVRKKESQMTEDGLYVLVAVNTCCTNTGEIEIPDRLETVRKEKNEKYGEDIMRAVNGDAGKITSDVLGAISVIPGYLRYDEGLRTAVRIVWNSGVHGAADIRAAVVYYDCLCLLSNGCSFGDMFAYVREAFPDTKPFRKENGDCAYTACDTLFSESALSLAAAAVTCASEEATGKKNEIVLPTGKVEKAETDVATEALLLLTNVGGLAGVTCILASSMCHAAGGAMFPAGLKAHWGTMMFITKELAKSSGNSAKLDSALFLAQKGGKAKKH